MNISLKKPFNLSCQRVYAFSILALFVLHLLGELLPMRVADLLDTYGLVCICLLFGVYLARFAGKSPIENKIYLIWIGWMLITRWLNGDVYLFVDFNLIITCILGFLFMSAGTVLDKKEREVFLDVLSLIYGGFAVIVATLGIFVFITNTYIHIPPEDVWFTIRYDGTVFAPNFLSTARLTAAPRLLMAWCLLVYQFVKRKNKLVRILIALSLFVLFTAISLCHSRTTQVALMACFVLIGMILGQCLFKKNNRVTAFLGSGVLALVFVFGCYFGNDIACKIISNAHDSIAPAFEKYYNSSDNKINEEYFGIGKSADELIKFDKEQKKADKNASKNALSSPNVSEAKTEVVAVPLAKASTQTLAKDKEITANDKRSLVGNWSFTGRTWVWHSGIVSIIRDPMIAVKGLLSKQVAPTFNGVMSELYPKFKAQINMHNAFMEVLMVSGIPGLLLILLWTVLIVVKMVKLFFAKNIGFELKLLTLPLAALFVVSLAETLLFGWIELCSIIFYLCAGAFLGYYKDSFPE